MAEKSLLQILAEARNQEVKNKNIIFADDVEKANLTTKAEQGLLSKPNLINELPLIEKDDVVTIGKKVLDRYEGINITRPDVYDLLSIDDSKAGVIVKKQLTIDNLHQDSLNFLSKVNKYLPSNTNPIIDYDIPLDTSYIEQPQTDYLNRYDFDFDITNNTDLINIYLGNALIDETPLSVHASQRIRELYEINVTENILDQTVGRINNSFYSLLQGDRLIRDFNAITVPRTKIAKAADFLRRLSGYYIPIDYIPDTIFDEPNQYSLLLQYTSVLQKRRLQELLNKNTYRPYLVDETSDFRVDEFQYIGGEQTDRFNTADRSTGSLLNSSGHPKAQDFSPTYAIGKNPTNNKVLNRACIGSEESNRQFTTWQFMGQDITNFDKQSLLYKTQELVNNKRDDVWIDQTIKEFNFKINNEQFIISRGNSITTVNEFNADDGESIARNEFFRVWTKNRPYNRLTRTLRHSGLYNEDKRSVLQDNGLVKVAPHKRDNSLDANGFLASAGDGINIKKYMLSIENLAWADNWFLLPPCEQGSGDLLSGNRGRIMWFPPYNLNFSEDNTVDWEEHKFIGRPESVYTYNSSQRSGSLSFSLVVDHPSIVNKIKEELSDSEEIDLLYERYYAGDKEVLRSVNQLRKGTISPELFVQQQVREQSNQPLQETIQNTVIKNNQMIDLDIGIETNGDGNLGVNIPSNDNKHSNFIQTILDGDTSPIIVQFNSNQNYNELCENIKAYIRFCYNDYVKTNISDDSQVLQINEESIVVTNRVQCVVNDDLDDTTATISLQTTEIETQVVTTTVTPTINDSEILDVTRSELADLTYDECDFFKYLETNTPLTYKSISDKIDYFSPVFHSTTPEGFNSRLNFLHQCTRQGDSIGRDGVDNTRNLAFGRPPVCILRIGDFIHTKILIKSYSVDYGGTETVWDLNPESNTGVQPMIANVTLNFDMIGGQSLNGAINKIQNALSYNFYANTEMYDYRSDTLRVKSGDSDNVGIENLNNNNYRQTKNEIQNQFGENGRIDVLTRDNTVDDVTTENATQNNVTLEEYRNNFNNTISTLSNINFNF